MTDPHLDLTSSLEDLIAHSKQPDKLTLVSLAMRPGALRFMTVLEWQYFTPQTQANTEFEFIILKWPDPPDALVWTVAILPLAIQPHLAAICEETGMRLGQGVPTVIDSRGIQRFPMNHDRVFTLENNPDSPIYLPHGDTFVREEERRWLKQFYQEKGLPWP